MVLGSTHETTFSAGGNLGGFAAEVPLVHKHFATELFPRLFRLIGELGKPVDLRRARPRAGRRVGAGAGLRPGDRLRARDVRDARDQRRRVPVHDHGAHLPQHAAQEDDRAAAARRAHRRAGGRAAGLVNRVVAADEFDAAVADWAGRLAAKSPVLMRLGKDALWRQQDMALEDAWDFLRSQLTIAFSTEDIQEGVRRSSRSASRSGRAAGMASRVSPRGGR